MGDKFDLRDISSLEEGLAVAADIKNMADGLIKCVNALEEDCKKTEPEPGEYWKILGAVRAVYSIVALHLTDISMVAAVMRTPTLSDRHVRALEKTNHLLMIGHLMQEALMDAMREGKPCMSVWKAVKAKLRKMFDETRSEALRAGMGRQMSEAELKGE